MDVPRRVALASAAIAMIAAVLVDGSPSSPAVASNALHGRFNAPACPGPGGPHAASCHARFVSDQVGTPLTTSTYQSGLTPAQARKAYGFDQIAGTGAGQTIAIVDAYGSPTIANDLAVFSQQFGLPAANLTIAKPQGSRIPTDGGWALETSLDVEWAHAIAPDANILLVVAADNSFTNLFAAVQYANTHGAVAVSMSWGGSEFCGETTYDSYFTTPGVTYFASSGDSGHGVIYPSSSPNVVSVGGTTLSVTSDGSYVSESAWGGSGGGISAIEVPTSSFCPGGLATPSYQSGFQTFGAGRGTPDVAYDADPHTGFAVYDTTLYQGQRGWWVVGGTSAGAPQWAALAALAASSGVAPLYSFPSDYHDIATGSNGSCGPQCNAAPGYDLVTGLGSPKANLLIPALGGGGAATPTPSPTGSAASPTSTATSPTGSQTPTSTSTKLPAATSTATPTASSTSTRTPTAPPIPSSTPTRTATPTTGASGGGTATPTLSPTPCASRSCSAVTSTATPSGPTSTPTLASQPTATPTPASATTATWTPAAPSATPTSTETVAPIPSATPSPTRTLGTCTRRGC
ncbi:MAG TPA: S53 family peptidase [Chloroflexota bacterium]|nr:S53 family peptidase [Chloroflexota bacterium]